MDRSKSKTSFQITVHSKPQPYRPGDGPPLAPLAIVPENDSDAFIVEKRVIPSTAANGELKLHMYYIVGWPDLPAARVPILATDVYDYVSQRTVEDFEYRASLKQDEEDERKEAEKRRRAEVAAKKKANHINATNATNTPATPGTPTAAGRRRRGRPSKATLQARQLARQTVLDSSADIEVPLTLTNTSGPSLSTPKKRRPGELTADMDEDEADADNAIFRQLCGDNSNLDDMDVGNTEDGDELLPSSIPKTISSSTEISAYARKLPSNNDSTVFERANGKLALKSSTSHVPVPNVLRSNKQFPPKPLPPKLSPPKTSVRRKSITAVPVPLPFQLSTPSKPIDGHRSNTLKPAPTPLRYPKPLDGKYSTTPIPVPSWPHSTNGTREPPASAPPVSRTISPPRFGFTPAGRSSGGWPSSLPPESMAAADGAGSPLGKQKNPREREESSRPVKKSKHQHVPKEAEEDPQVWIVDRLEGDKTVVTEDGGHERYYKVRWEGEWPPDQNPTWEPEENIAPHLVKRYLKKKRRPTHDSKSSPARNGGVPSKTPPKPLLKRKYSSVMEAFEDDEAVAQNQGEDHMNEEESDGQEEILMVTTEGQTYPTSQPDGAKFMRDLAAAINSSRDKGNQP
ncbi:hypothetical protein F4821DRAFT_242537 [Hypoxylon rubiginosum]|uniref:Uncharacterized protein n=1 Tax=Hypoxylon rubiginosum TaxID=110542 RepID=A0ACC0CVV9_9PEZI|nr:hypothetical protein F4821DRAFT_242537 [Hypoxylon rubiginosum]